jgi:hypothetical protein
LVTNGFWTPDVPFVGADVRRITGLSFDIRFVDEPVGPNEMLKDSGIKEALREYLAEFWFMVRVFWFVEQPRPKSDHTMPQGYNTLGVVSGVLGAQMDEYEVDKATVEKYIDTRLMIYTLAEEKPSTSAEVDEDFADFIRKEIPGFTIDAVKKT